MGYSDFDSNSESDWEESWDTVWSEFDWERYLQGERDEVKKYQKLYNKLIRSQNRLDEVALYMGWERPGNNDSAETIEPSIDAIPEQPYTLHKHPLFVASKALHGWLQERWTQHVSLCADQVSPTMALNVQQAISQSDYYGLLAVTALDLGDYSLAIAYFKRGLVSINNTLSFLDKVDDLKISALSSYTKQARVRLFDVREIWLRVTADCRAAAPRPSEEE